jgi:phage terminase small subunit
MKLRDDPNNELAQKRRKKISKKEIEWLGHFIEMADAKAAGLKVGFNARKAKRTAEWIKSTRERSAKPYLWDIWRQQMDKHLRILDAKNDTIIRELCLIAFSSIDRFVELPSRTPDSEGATRENIKVKYIEDIPKDLIPSIASIKETKDGIEVKLHSKMDALDKLARITKLFNNEPQDEVPFGGEINIHVKGTKSPLLLSIENKSLPSDTTSK